MKNNYLFDFFQNKETLSNFDKNDIFFMMLDIVTNGTLVSTLDSIDALSEMLYEDTYFIAHNLVTYKGKKIIFKGNIVIGQKNDLLSFLKYSIESDDLRPLLIAPALKKSPEYVIYLTEDVYYLYRSKLI